MMTRPPVFIHSLYRSGSTYLFNVFRRAGDAYWCYQEPENEWLLELDERPDVLLAVGAADAQSVNHPSIGNPYFWEFVQIKDALHGLFRAEFCFQDIFLESLTPEQNTYFKALIDNARATPVLQFCRSFGRASALKQAFAGHHIHLWREPRSQWWSFKINDYFDAATQLIFDAASLPAVLKEIREQAGLGLPSFGSLHEARHYAEQHTLKWRESYFSFFALWLYSNIELEKASDVSVCIDLISVDDEARGAFVRQCDALGVSGLDLGDCNVPQIRFSSTEAAEYDAIEQEVKVLFLRHFDETCVFECFTRLKTALDARAEQAADGSSQALQARKIVKRLTDAYASASVENEEQFRALHDRLLNVDHYCRDLEKAVAIKDEHIVSQEKQIAEFVTAQAILERHAQDTERQIHDFEFALGLKDEHIKAVDHALNIKDEYITTIEGYNKDLVNATQIQENHIRMLENRIKELESARGKAF